MFRRSDIIYFGEGRPKKPRVTFADHEKDAKRMFRGNPVAQAEYLRQITERQKAIDKFPEERRLREKIEEDAKKMFQDPAEREKYLKQSKEIMQSGDEFQKMRHLRSTIEEDAKKIQDEETRAKFRKQADEILKGRELYKTTKDIQSAVEQAEEIKRLQKENIEDAYLKAYDDSKRLQEGSLIRTKAIIENPNRSEEMRRLQKEALEETDDFWEGWEEEFAEPEIPQQKLSKEEFIQKAFPSSKPARINPFNRIAPDDPIPIFPHSKEREMYEQEQIAEQMPGLEQISTENITLNQPKKSSILSKIKNISLFKKNQTPYASTYKFEEGVDLPINEDINMSTISREDFLNKMANETPFETEINAPLTPEHKKIKPKIILPQSPRIAEISESIGSDEVFQTPTEGLSRQSSIAPKGRYTWPEGVSRQTSEAPSMATTTVSQKRLKDKLGLSNPGQLAMDINEYHLRRDQPENIYARKKAKELISSPSRYNRINKIEKLPETTYEATTRHQGVLEAKKRTLPPSNFESKDIKIKKELKQQEELKRQEEQLEKDTDERIDTEIKLIQNKDKIVTRNREELLDLLENNSDFKERGEILNMIKELPPPRSSKGYMRSLDKNNKILNEEDKIKNTTKQRLLDLYKKTKYDKERLDILAIIKNYN